MTMTFDLDNLRNIAQNAAAGCSIDADTVCILANELAHAIRCRICIRVLLDRLRDENCLSVKSLSAIDEME